MAMWTNHFSGILSENGGKVKNEKRIYEIKWTYFVRKEIEMRLFSRQHKSGSKSKTVNASASP